VASQLIALTGISAMPYYTTHTYRLQHCKIYKSLSPTAKIPVKTTMCLNQSIDQSGFKAQTEMDLF